MHFFIDHLQIAAQAAEDGYGPDSTDPSTLFNVTSRFQLTNEAKAFACQQSMMIVQQSSVDASLVNVILEPIDGLDIPLAVRYYVYRGILKSSLIDGADILPQATTNNELVARIWTDPPQDTGAGTLGFDDNAFQGTDNIETIFDNSRVGVKPILVKEGEWFGNFGKHYTSGTAQIDYKIGFEVVLQTDGLKLDLNYARAERYHVDVSDLAGLSLRAKREEILCFIDPAAFFGMHASRGISYSTYAGTTKTTSNTIERVNNVVVNNTYSLLVNPFATRNRVYLDVRSEKGCSYNFYQNYRNPTDNHNIKIGYGTVGPVSQEYQSDEWPIVFVGAAQTTNATQNNVRFKLRVDDNLKPTIYVENIGAKNTNKTSNYIRDSEILQGQATDWSRELRLVFPNTGGGATRHNVATYLRLYYFRGRHNPNAPNSVLRNLKYYDSAFCTIDLAHLGEATLANTHLKGAAPSYIREPLQADGTGNFAYAAVNGAYWDTERILFYSTKINEQKNISSEKFYLNTYTRKLDITNDKFSASSLRRNTDVLCREYELPGPQSIRILGLNAYRTTALNEKENALLLGLTLPELAAIKGAAGLSDKHNRYIFLEPDAGNPLTDNGGTRYHRFTVQVQGLDINGIPTTVTPLLNNNPILVYSRDKVFFCSANFSANEVVSPGLNRIEFHIYHDHCVKVNDNIDLSLVHDVQPIFYLYHDAAGVTHEICNLDVLQITKMGSGHPVNSVPAGYARTIPYTQYGVNAKTSYVYEANGVTTRVITNGNKTGKPPNYKLEYLSLKKTAFLVSLPETNFPVLNISFTYSNTRRRYCSPEVAAAFFGALAQVGFAMTSTGSCFEDGTSFPSLAHNNGFAIDTLYLNVLENDQAFINAMRDFGCTDRIKGHLTYHNGLINARADITSPFIHDGHLHCGVVALPTCDLDE